MRLARREMLALCGVSAIHLSGKVALGDLPGAYPIGACDWSLRASQNPQAFEVAKDIGLDGVQVSFGAPGGEFDLRKPEVQKEFQAASRRTGVAIASLAMGILNSVPFATEPQTEEWVAECIDVMAAMGQKIVLLAFFGKGDIRDKPDLQAEVIRRLKRLAPKAEKAGVILGIESMLNVDDHLRILDAVGSPAVKVYYDVANMHYAGYDIFAEMRRLGAERICQVHTKEHDHLLGQGPIDFVKVRDVLQEIGYRDWLILEGATVKGRSLVDCYRENRRFLRELFGSGNKAS